MNISRSTRDDRRSKVLVDGQMAMFANNNGVDSMTIRDGGTNGDASTSHNERTFDN